MQKIIMVGQGHGIQVLNFPCLNIKTLLVDLSEKIHTAALKEQSYEILKGLMWTTVVKISKVPQITVHLTA